MKQKNYLVALLLLVAGVQTAVAQKMIVTMEDNSKVEYDMTRIINVTFVETSEPSEHEWVDLGLPSGTLWATCNVGANSPEQYGDHFAWGETVQREDYTPSAYTYSNLMETITAYDAQSNDKCLLPEYDAATANWGGDWQMPSAKQFDELINDTYTTMEWTTQNGVYGRKITSRSNGNSIFLPAAGYRWSDIVATEGTGGEYWSRSLNTDNTSAAYYLYFRENNILMDSTGGHFGRSVRPVITGTNTAQLVTGITLNYTSLSLQLNETATLTATVLPANADNKNVAWTSSDEAVATVSAHGLVTAVGFGSCVITCSATDGSGVKAECQVTVKETHGTTDGHEWVDLGLPSGTLWATYNIGASSPEEYGDYFAWGETEPKNEYNWSTYQWCNGSFKTMTKYCTESDYGYNGFTDNLTELQPEDDAATANWGSGWQMPSNEKIKELYNSKYTTTEWIQVNGVNGRKITSKSNGNSIFLPAAGDRADTELYDAGSGGWYWSRSLSTSYSIFAFDLHFISSNIQRSGYERYSGQCVRPVISGTNYAQFVKDITLNHTALSLQLNETETLTAIVLPANADNKEVAWISSDENVATVSADGLVTAVTLGTCIITCYAKDGSAVEAECQVRVRKPDTMEFVDLGLPSGTLWATCNVGASSPEEYGDYFAWGETEPKSIYDWSTYKYCNGSFNTFTKYCTQSDLGYNGFTDTLTELLPEDDAATTNWGSIWQMPSPEQFEELINSEYTTSEWTTQNGVNGKLITSKSNGNSIFLPAAGFRTETNLFNTSELGRYWSRTFEHDFNYWACSLNFGSLRDEIQWGSIRERGFTVRPVRVNEM